MDKFAERLKEMRTEKNITQKELAEILNTTDDSIYSWEKGRSQPSIEMICAIACYFDVSAGYLIGLEDEFGVPDSNLGGTLTDEERDIINIYRTLDDKQKKTIKDALTFSDEAEK